MVAPNTSPRSSQSSGSPPARLVSELEGDPDMRELVTEFLSELPERLATVQKAHASGEVESLTRLAHQLKGACAGYGFPTIGHAAGKLESTMKSGHEDALARAKADVDELVTLLQRALR